MRFRAPATDRRDEEITELESLLRRVVGARVRNPDTVEYWLPFSDANRRFYALVVLGPHASKETRDQAFAILDRLRFDPAAQPSWKSSP